MSLAIPTAALTTPGAATLRPAAPASASLALVLVGLLI
jgi:hypothetical protein